MNVVRFESAAGFDAAASPFLEEHEAEHNLILGIVARLVRGGRPGPHEPAAPPAFWLVEDCGRSAGAAMITSPHDLVVSRCADGVPRALAAELAAEGWELPGLQGPAGAADALVARAR